MYPQRTLIKNEILVEFFKPSKPSRRVLILCSGMPSVPIKTQQMQFWADCGFWVFFPRYRGSWESKGQFLKKSPHLDILDLIDQLPKGFQDLHDDKEYKLKPSGVYIIGSSFGGPAALLASMDRRVKKVIAVCPVVDWTYPSKAEPLQWFFKYLQKAFAGAYRMKKEDWQKLAKGKIYNPMKYAHQIDGKKVLMFHAKDDDVVDYHPVVDFAKKTGAKLHLLRKGGHISAVMLQKAYWFKKVKEHLK